MDSISGRIVNALAKPVLVGALIVGTFGCSQERKALTPPLPPVLVSAIPDAPIQRRSPADVQAADANCVACHKDVGDPHAIPQSISCVDCHGGKAFNLEEALRDTNRGRRCPAAPEPKYPDRWNKGSANPERPYNLGTAEHWDWMRFVNPGDLRVAHITCGGCHAEEVLNVRKGIMTTATHFWGTVAYSNGIVSAKKSILGEAYAPDGSPLSVKTIFRSEEEKAKDMEMSVAEQIFPLPHWEAFQPGNVFRVFEKGSRLGGAALGLNGFPIPLIGVPDKFEDPGRPNNRLSDRGLGTLLRVDLPLLNVHKTRLNDPYLSFMGTNDAPGDYRSSGCTGCHVVYANDRSPYHSGPYAEHGNQGFAANPDPVIPKGESGHPIEHKFTSAIPSSQCMNCHMHQPNSFVNTYYGFQMWSYETDGELMWPKQQKNPSSKEFVAAVTTNPEEAASRGNWIDRDFLQKVSTLNPQLKHTQFADYHGHGWIFRAVFKMDRKGNLLDKDDNVIPYDSPDKFEGVVPTVADGQKAPGAGDELFSKDFLKAGRAVHLKDIHAEYGMHCVDCHYKQDVHGSGKIVVEYQAAVEITCQDCHGDATKYATLTTTGPASYTSALKDTSFEELQTPFGKPRFEVVEDAQNPGRKTIYQNSMLHEGMRWRVRQVKDSVDSGHPLYNEKAAKAKLVKRDGSMAAPGSATESELAHRTDSRMMCQSCHTSWITSCFGCHLPQQANMRTRVNHYEYKYLRNLATYNPQVARDDAFMLGITGDVHDNRISTVRSSSAVLISSEDAQRQKIYVQIPTTASNGMSSQAFNTHYAHTVRTKETRKCDDCHVSEKNDNNAWLAQVFLLGTNFVNFFGYNAYIGTGAGGLAAVQVTEWPEPQAILGSNLHSLAYPDNYQDFVNGGRELEATFTHKAGGPEAYLKKIVGGKGEILSVQLRGEYVFTASGKDGFRVYDVANVGNKGFSEKIVTAPFSPLGQDTHVKTKYATAVELPTNNYISMNREWRPENREQEYKYRGRSQNMHEIYRYAYVTDLEEGLIVIDVDCLSDGNPQNNFTKRVATFNPGGQLAGAVNLAVAGETVYVCARDGLFVISISDPLEPKLLGKIGAPQINTPQAVAVQFRYAFVCDADGVKVVDVTNPAKATFVEGATVSLGEAQDIYVARTYAYVAAGSQGMVILDVEVPTAPKQYMVWNGDGQVNDVREIKVGMSYDSVFAFVADGRNGFRIVQLVSPEDTDVTKRSAYGFSPVPLPKLIATYPTSTPCVAVSKGLDRDRAVDESGNQMAVFGRLGGRPLRLDEMQKFYLRDGEVYTVTND